MSNSQGRPIKRELRKNIGSQLAGTTRIKRWVRLYVLHRFCLKEFFTNKVPQL